MVKKLMTAIFSLMLSVNFVQAIIIDDGVTVDNISSGQRIMDILNWILGLIMLISILLFLVGVYQFFKGKKKEDLKILSFIWKVFIAFIFSSVFLFGYFFLLAAIISWIAGFFNLGYGSSLYYLPGLAIIAFYVYGIYLYAKALREFLALNLLIVISILFFLIANLIYILMFSIVPPIL